MKVLEIGGEFYLYPPEIKNIDEFVDFLEKNESKFIKMRKLFEEKCVSPYYIFEEIKEVWVASAAIDEICEAEVVVSNRNDYEKMLNTVKKKLCSRCEEREKCLSDPKEEYRDKLCLDGSCFEFYEE